MKKHLLIAALAAALAFPAFCPAAAEPVDPAEQALAKQEAEDHATLVEARVAALKAGLKLTPAQEKDWTALEKVLREVVVARAGRRKAFLAQAAEFHEKDEVVQSIKLVGQNLVARGEELQKVAAAAAPLFESLDAAQKHRFALLLHSFAAPNALN
ncbi:Spy/CpxP family protein refolding chaperone [uncultured Rhodoblastus sp.]|uniref:Spy/CpxP family protein refolding chaperone n=1 Tax=uncultured Rhodoblastus sp. TaxID=543037 RepID=UPI0025FC94D9|nr:Spy/CpxP family protein refolding chaperone [uncultured Rhodoblastus sp.]